MDPKFLQDPVLNRLIPSHSDLKHFKFVDLIGDEDGYCELIH